MFLGLIAEALDGNSFDAVTPLVTPDGSASESATQDSICYSVYKNYIVTENDTHYVHTTVRFFPDLQESWTMSPVNSQENLVWRCQRLGFCRYMEGSRL